MNIYVIAFPRSGMHWLSWMLAEVLNAPVQFMQQVSHPERTGDHWVYGCHALPKYYNGRVLYLKRDPRDVAVSWKHFWEYTTYADAIKAIGKKWRRHVDTWMPFANAHTTYEALKADTLRELELVTKALNLVVSPVVLQHAVEAHTVEKDREHALSLGENHGSLVRKGVTGEWQDVFNDSERKLAQRYWS